MIIITMIMADVLHVGFIATMSVSLPHITNANKFAFLYLSFKKKQHFCLLCSFPLFFLLVHLSTAFVFAMVLVLYITRHAALSFV